MNNPPRILIVDDNETNRDILMTRLGAQGYELAQAADGEEALAAATNDGCRKSCSTSSAMPSNSPTRAR